MASDNLVENDQIVEALSIAIAKGEGGLSSVPNLVKRVIREGMWQQRIVRQSGEITAFERFSDFILAKPPEGLGADLKSIVRLCTDDLEATSLLDAALKEEELPQGRPEKNLYIIQDKPKPPTGDYTRAVLRRLRNARPDLHDKVLLGELSPHAAMLEAGFRPRRTAINLDNLESAAKTIVESMEPDKISELIELLQQRLEGNEEAASDKSSPK